MVPLKNDALCITQEWEHIGRKLAIAVRCGSDSPCHRETSEPIFVVLHAPTYASSGYCVPSSSLSSAYPTLKIVVASRRYSSGCRRRYRLRIGLKYTRTLHCFRSTFQPLTFLRTARSCDLNLITSSFGRAFANVALRMVTVGGHQPFAKHTYCMVGSYIPRQRTRNTSTASSTHS